MENRVLFGARKPTHDFTPDGIAPSDHAEIHVISRRSAAAMAAIR